MSRSNKWKRPRGFKFIGVRKNNRGWPDRGYADGNGHYIWIYAGDIL